MIYTATAALFMPSIYCVFKYSKESALENIVGFLTGRYVHVDVVLDRACYTSYMFETFSENPLPDYSPDTHVCLEIHATPQEFEAALQYVRDLVERKVCYNYKDMVHCVMPTKDFLGDVQDPLQSVYCSQAVFRCLKTSLVRNTTLVECFKGVNSRFITPNMLFELLVSADVAAVALDVLGA